MALKPSSLLWRLEREDAPGPSFLFGTMHVRDSRAFESLGAVYSAIESCGAFATEFHLEESDPLGIGTVIQLPDERKLEELLGRRHYARLRKIVLKTTGIDLNMMPRIVPFALMNIIDTAIFASDYAVSLDEHLWEYAQNCSKQMHGLETLEEQLDILRRIPTSYQCRALLDLARNLPQHRRQLNRLATLYAQGNIQQLYQSSRKNLGAFRKILLFNRNRIMAQRLDELARRTTICAAVGAAHLGGGKGMIRLLKSMGWRATAMRYLVK